jgi:enoyl-CoA hydratase
MIRDTLHPSGVLELAIDRPPVNAFDIGLLGELAALLEGIKARAEVRAVLLRAEGKGFCAGGDVKEVQSLPGFEGILGQTSGSLRASLAAINCAVPVVAAVHNYCVGVGVLVVGCADVVVAAHGTRFILAEVDNGATAGAIQALRLMPEKRLRAAMMTAEPVDAEELQRYGTVFRVAETSVLPQVSLDIAARIAMKNPRTMRRLKSSLNGTTKAADLEAVYRAELSYTYELNILGDASAGRGAFLSGERESYLK